jgi:S1-C subfamily serine protease
VGGGRAHRGGLALTFWLGFVFCALAGTSQAQQKTTQAAGLTEFSKILPSVVSVLPVWPRGRRNLQEPEGSGVVILDGRTIITANHVVAPARAIYVRTSDGRIVKARLKGGDKATDLAVLEIDTTLPALAFGGDARLGERVCAIGNAFGYGLSVTCGVVSAVHRAGVGFNRIEDFVQTDAAVNPGASGGALIGRDGKLLGLLSGIFTKGRDGNLGVSFAVSAPLTKLVARKLARAGKVRHPRAGMRLARHPPAGEAGEQAALVLTVSGKSPASAAGIMPGDLILNAGTRRIRNPDEFNSALARAGSGARIEIKLRRDGGDTPLALTLTLP